MARRDRVVAGELCARRGRRPGGAAWRAPRGVAGCVTGAALVAALVSAASVVGCGSDDEPTSRCDAVRAAGVFRDLGALPVASMPRALLEVDGDLLVATEAGVFRRPLDGSGAWSTSGMGGLVVTSLARDPDTGDVFAGIEAPVGEELEQPSLWVSADGGRTWTEDADGLVNEFESTEERTVWAKVVQIMPTGDGVLYVSGPAGSIARREGDGPFVFVEGSSDSWGYDCVATVQAGALYHGCELPLDVAWVDRYPIEEGGLGDVQHLIVHPDIDNRKPNVLYGSPDHEDLVYVGAEGALFVVSSAGERRDIYRAADELDSWYSYMRAVWVNPDDRAHVVFGGRRNSENTRLQLYETCDEGRTVVMLDPPPYLAPGDDEYMLEAGLTVGADRRELVVAVARTSDSFPTSISEVRIVARRQPLSP